MTARRKPPLTSHRWFPAALALWFAALFGLTSLALPPALLERLVLALGLDRVIAAAAPPLGETARLLIAAGLSSVGEIVGLLLGRRLAARHRPKPAAPARVPEDETAPAQNAPAESPPRQPFSAAELLEAETGLADLALPIDPPGNPAEPALVAATPQSQSALTTDIASAPLDSLGVVQLSERLALALQARRPETLFGNALEGGAQVTALASLQRISGAR